MSKDQPKMEWLWRSLSFNQSAPIVMAAYAVCFATATVAILLYAIGHNNPWQVIALGSLFGGGAEVAGGVIGFLFALPRSITVGIPTGSDGQSRELRGITVRPNTNLEEVSDWITKIIIALTLTQLGKIPGAAGRLFVMLGHSLGGSSQDVAFAGSLVVFSFIVGFLMGWLVTRMFIGRWMAASDEPLEAAAAEAIRRDDTQAVAALARGRAGKVAAANPSDGEGRPGYAAVPEDGTESHNVRLGEDMPSASDPGPLMAS
jgi:hypothetical protein